MAREMNSDAVTTTEIPKVKITKESLRETLLIFTYIRPYRVKFIAGLIFIALSTATTMAFPYMIATLIDTTNPKASHLLPFTPGIIALLMIGILVFQMIFSYMRIHLFTAVGENALKDMRKDIYQRMITMPMDFFAQRRVGELSSRLTSDLAQIQDAVTVSLAEILRGVITLIAGMVILFFISSSMTLLMLSVVPIIAIMGVLMSKRIRKISRRVQDQLADSNIIVQETLQGISNVKAFSNEWYEMSRYSLSVDKVVNLAMRYARFRGVFVSLMIFCVFGSIVLVVWFGIGLMHAGTLTNGNLIEFSVYSVFIGATLAGFADIYSQFQKIIGATQRVRELLRDETEPINVVEEPLQKTYKLHGQVEFKNVAFNYASRRDVDVLRDITLSVSKGEQVAIVGASGAGKSTLISLLLRFYDPDSGSLQFDGKDAQSFPLSQLRMQMSLVPQDVMLFGGSIFENIAYGKPNASRDEVEAAAHKANAHEFIIRFPEAYSTIVGERGIMLSGGQRQRIAIARAILKDPVILILDEATSSLDSESEALVQEALENLMKNRTSFVIAHRLSTIRNADKIIVLENGMVKETGTHLELIALDGLYKNFSKLQFDLN